MLVLDRRTTGEDLAVEIQPRSPLHSTAAADLRRLGIEVRQQSRVVRIDTRGVPLDRLRLEVLADPLTEAIALTVPADEAGTRVDVFCRPGVTDAEGEMAAAALHLSGTAGVVCHAGTRYRFDRAVPMEERTVVERLVGNPLIHRFVWFGDRIERAITSGDLGASPVPGMARVVDMRNAGNAGLLGMSREHGLALDLAEMEAIAAHFRRLGRPPTDVELQSIALTWSEHCSHKTFKATIHFDHDGRRTIIHGLLADCLIEPTRKLNRPWVRSAFVDNAGVIAFDRRHDLAFKVETHNHPSALEPYGGAHTGVGGVIRDILAVSAEPVANTDVLCFGPPDLPEDRVPAGVFHPRRTCREVVRGVAAYGNNMGIPTVGGAVLFHPGYTANPLVYCGTLGIAPAGSHPRNPRPNDQIVLLGGRTGRDGLHGATMSSEKLDRETVASSAVQIGAPITEKVLRDVLPHLRDERLYHAITDCGAGGLCSAVGEMGETLGVEVDLASVPLKYAGLTAWEIWLSEAQERMVLAVPDDAFPRLVELCREHGVEVSSIGRFRDDGLLSLEYAGTLVAELDMSFLHRGRPARVLQARWSNPPSTPSPAHEVHDATHSLLTLLRHPDIGSKEEIIRRYDHEVGGATVIKPLVGNGGPSDAAVLCPLGTGWRGAVLAHGINPLFAARDPHAMTMLAVDEALRNLVAVGGSIDRAALLDNFCWGRVDDPEALGSLVRAAQGCRDAALAYRVPFISGKDSLRNTSLDDTGEVSIPGTLLISALGVVPDARRCTTMDLKETDSRLYLLGTTRDELGGSHYLLIEGEDGGRIPRARPEESRRVMRSLTRAIRRGLVSSCHDLSEGGLAVAAAEMALAGSIGLQIDLDRMPAETESPAALLFAESSGRFLVEVPEEQGAAFERLFAGLPCCLAGHTTGNGRFLLRHAGNALIDLTVEEIEAAWKGTSSTIMPAADVHGIEPADGRTRPAAPADMRDPGTGRAGVRGAQCGPTVMILTAAGVNCDRETIEACRMAGARVEAVHLNQLLSGRRTIRDFGMLVLPGGFSYGDHLGAGAMLAAVLRHRFLKDVLAFVADGRPLLGICNGFQILARLGLLGEIGLVANSSGRFECRWVGLEVERSPSIFLRGIERLELPVAHGEGRVVAPVTTLPELLERAPLRYRENPNGSIAGIAGVCNAAGNILGLMPHPERYLTPYHHPRRHPEAPAGLTLFRNAMRYIREDL